MRKVLALLALLVLLVVAACSGSPEEPAETSDPTVTHPIAVGPAVEPPVRAFSASHLPPAASVLAAPAARVP